MATSINARLMGVAGYLFAFSPALALYLSWHTHVLHRTPLALSFVLIGTIARIFGRGPSILAPVITAVVFNYCVAVPENAWALTAQGLFETCIILTLGLVIAYLFQAQQEDARSLRSAHRALQEKTNALIFAQQGSNSAAWEFDATTRKTTWFEGGSELFGRSLAEITALGSPTSLVLEEDQPRIAAAAAHTAKTGKPFQVEFRVVWPNGEIRWLEACGSPKASDPSLWLGVTMDITNRKTAELALVRSEKLLVTGRLASSVSHEINNPLEAMINLLYLARVKAVDDEQRAYLKQAEREIARIAYITSQSLQFHRQQSAPIKIDVSEILRDLLTFHEPKIAEAGIILNLDMQEAPKLLCCASEIRQALGNLIQNALDAMTRGGRMRLRVRPGTDWRNGVKGLRITIADTGNGMSAQTRRRIYEPFFTTKDATNTGLGLWVTAGIVDRHGGSIRVWSSTNPARSGTVFSVLLPLQPGDFSGAEVSTAEPLVAISDSQQTVGEMLS